MQRVLIDKLIVPEESKQQFLEAARKVQSFIKTLPGFVEGFLYEKADGASPYNYMTTAIWKDDEAFENARKAVAEEFKRQGYDPLETRKRLKIEGVRAEYTRSPY